VLVDFMTTTAPARVSERRWRELFQQTPEAAMCEAVAPSTRESSR
jgi:hypothetical protein